MKWPVLIPCLFISMLQSSGGYDHGTSTGKGLVELDFTWNPFNYFEHGQSYVVFGYGLTKQVDIHGYYSIHTEGFHTYYSGLYYQFLNSNHLDLATAIGLRTNRTTGYTDVFVPQILYTVKLDNNYAIGGSFVNIINSQRKKNDGVPVTIDIALLIPLNKFITLPPNISELKLALGLFNPVNNSAINEGQFIPTYSLDIKFKWQK